MLAFLAMIILGAHMLSSQRYEILVNQRDIQREMEEMAGSIALETMETIRTRDFDQAVSDSLTQGLASDVALFTFNNSSDHFPSGKACSVFGTGTDNCDDIDDFHNMQTALMPFAMGEDTLFFNVDIKVDYVTLTASKAAAQTTNKRVTINVQDYSADSTHYIPTPIELKRVLSYEF